MSVQVHSLQESTGPLTGGAKRAVEAWQQLMGTTDRPAAIAKLRHHPKTAVYRLDLGSTAPSVIAKRGPRQAIVQEAWLYREILNRQPTSILAFHGVVVPPGGRYGWLFLEDAGSRRYGPQTEGYPELGVAWLATLHGATTWTTRPDGLDQGGAPMCRDRYLQPLLATVKQTLPPAGNAGCEEFRRLQPLLEIIASEWSAVDAFCQRMPHCLVHGDFVEKNIGIRTTAETTCLLPYDWETASYGPPATDIACCGDLTGYAARMASRWPQLHPEDFSRLESLGHLFRALASLQWRSPEWAKPWLPQELDTLRVYTDRLERAWTSWRRQT